MPTTDRFEPQAARAMASMFDDVSGRYDLLNRVMTLGQDGAWREAMWRGVPDEARVVLDLCTGSGVSLPGLRRPGRIVLGMDVSFAMLAVAQEQHGGEGWAPRLACADAFRLPVRAGALDAITVAFGVRNLRPRAAALAELARTLHPGGVLVVLEATAPAPGPLQALHRLWVRHVIPLAGRLSPDPTAYRYLSQSIFEFGAGPEFERDLVATGFEVTSRRGFLFGATRLWVARRLVGVGQNPTEPRPVVQVARPGPHRNEGSAAMEAEAVTWRAVQAAVSTALTLALVLALLQWIKFNAGLPLNLPERVLGWALIGAGIAIFGGRSVWQWLRVGAGAQKR